MLNFLRRSIISQKVSLINFQFALCVLLRFVEVTEVAHTIKFPQYILLVEGRLSGAAKVDFVGVGDGIGVDLRESEDSCVRGSAVSVCPHTQWFFLLNGERDSWPDGNVGRAI